MATSSSLRLAELRREYNLTNLRRRDLHLDPIVQFKTWFDQAAGRSPGGRWRRFFIQLYKLCFGSGSGPAGEANVAILATADRRGRPSARVILLKEVDERGFIFFTSYESRKGRELAANPHASLVFYWADQERQVCVAGETTRISREESEAYFKTRPRGSCVAAWASHQSETVENRSVLDQTWKRMTAKFAGQEVPMPANWGGYVLCPTRIEFWQGRPARLHDRFCYLRQADQSWQLERLCP
jgi:pyridoxamine 5'-phosphate oxidase